MNILVDIGHPAHVHFFKNAITDWRNMGHSVTVATRRIAIAEYLLTTYGIEYCAVSRKRTGYLGMGVELVVHASQVLALMIRKKIDVCIAIGGTFMVHAARLAGCKSIVFSDSENQKTANRITFPFADIIATPDCYMLSLGPKQRRYKGFHELAYLHPNRFSPNRNVLSKYRLDGVAYSIIRFIAWDAGHDIGIDHLWLGQKRDLIDAIGKHRRVVISDEGDLHAEFREMSVKFAPEDFHHLLYYADFCITEGATTASEACLLGTPTLYINPFELGYLRKLEAYGLLTIANPADNIIELAETLVNTSNDRLTIRGIADQIIAEQCDVTAFIIELIS